MEKDQLENIFSKTDDELKYDNSSVQNYLNFSLNSLDFEDIQFNKTTFFHLNTFSRKAIRANNLILWRNRWLN